MSWVLSIGFTFESLLCKRPIAAVRALVIAAPHGNVNCLLLQIIAFYPVLWCSIAQMLNPWYTSNQNTRSISV
jgi:hypothetical protein